MWKNGKEGNTEGRRIMEGKDGRRLKREKKTEPRKKGGCGRRGKGSGRTGKKRRAGSGRNVVGKNRVGGNKIIAAWLRRCGIK